MTDPVILTSLSRIRKHRPCASGRRMLTCWLCDRGITDPDARWPLAWVLDSNGRADAVWALRVTNLALTRLVKCDAAEWALGQDGSWPSTDHRRRHAIETARRYAVGRATAQATAQAAYASYVATAYATAYADDGWTHRLRSWLSGHLPPAAEPYRAVIHAGLWMGVAP